MLWMLPLVICPLLLLLLLYVVWKNVADADLTLLWNEQFGHKPGKTDVHVGAGQLSL